MVDCRVNGHPEPEVTWSLQHPSSAVSDIENRIKVLHYEGRSVLVLRAMSRDDGTIIMCTATNEASDAV